jgi:hypothetical protein
MNFAKVELCIAKCNQYNRGGTIDFYAKEMVMSLIARIIGLSLMTAALGVLLARVFFSAYSDRVIASFVLGCTGAIIGAVAGAAREIVARPAPGHSPPRPPIPN